MFTAGKIKLDSSPSSIFAVEERCPAEDNGTETD
jgi:hypothetical protein